MNQTKLIERLNGILDDLPAEAQRGAAGLLEIVEELEGGKIEKDYKATWTAIVKESRTCWVVAQDEEEAERKAKEGAFFGPPETSFITTLSRSKIKVEEISP